MPEPAGASRCFGFPDWVLLDKMAHIGRGDRATTSGAMTSDHRAIEVSFEVPHPPALSRFFVHFPDLKPGDSRLSARVVGADGAFLLLCVVFPVIDPENDWCVSEFFVYKAYRGTPSLHRLPTPYPVGLYSYNVAVLPGGDDGHGGNCHLVIPQRRFDADRLMYCDLEIFSTKTELWSSKVARMIPGSEGCYHAGFIHTKVLSLGGGSVAWVDLRYGILLCDDVLCEAPKMRLIPLPPLRPSNVEVLGTDGDLDSICDVTFSDGCFRFIEIEYPDCDDDNLTKLRWMATMLRRTVRSDNWEPWRTVDSAELSPTKSCVPYLFSKIRDDQDKLTLERVLSQCPTLDVYHDHVYLISKLKAFDPSGWLLAVDTENNKLAKVESFSAASEYLMYLQCSFSSYLSKVPPECAPGK